MQFREDTDNRRIRIHDLAVCICWCEGVLENDTLSEMRSHDLLYSLGVFEIDIRHRLLDEFSAVYKLNGSKGLDAYITEELNAVHV